jgi:hypothetical protein
VLVDYPRKSGFMGRKRSFMPPSLLVMGGVVASLVATRVIDTEVLNGVVSGWKSYIANI